MFNTWFRPARVRAQLLAAPETKATPPLIALTLAGRACWGARSYAALAREGVMQNAIAYRCVRMIAEAAASVPWLLYEGAAEIEIPSAARAARANPTRSEDGRALFERWYAYLQCAGNAYLEALSAGGEVRELYALRPDRVRAVPGPRGWPAAYNYTVDGHTTTIAPRSRHRLPAGAARDAVSSAGRYVRLLADRSGGTRHRHPQCRRRVDESAARQCGAALRRAGLQGPRRRAGSDQRSVRAAEARTRRRLSGRGNAGRPMVLEGGLDWKTMSYAPADMDFANSRDAAAREIALAFGVPPMLLGIPGDNTFSNYREANLSFWRQTVLPLVGRTALAADALARPTLRRKPAPRLRRRRGGCAGARPRKHLGQTQRRDVPDAERKTRGGGVLDHRGWRCNMMAVLSEGIL